MSAATLVYTMATSKGHLRSVAAGVSQATGGKQDVLDVMRLLYSTHAHDGSPVNAAALQQAAETV